MCGITGIFRYGASGDGVDPQVLSRMTDILSHRGPDGRGIWTSNDRRVGFGHRRLSILDLTEAGSQPMLTPNRLLSVIYNGEIYNYREIRNELESLDYRFCSQTDTEVLLHGYSAWGNRLLDRLNGMFAFALWDDVAKRLWLVRDRMGIKPLFYFDDGATLLFGSEIKAILAHPSVPRRPDLAALHQFLALNYIAAPATGFSGIRQLLPGEEMEVGLASGPQRRRYWEIPLPERPLDITLQEATEELERRLGDAVERRLVSDVPLGAFLSGGIDSSSILRAMRERSPGVVKAFSVGFDEESHDELRFAHVVARTLGLSHRVERISASVASLLPSLMLHTEEPLADSSSIPCCLVSWMARKHVTVALSGDGADELLGGYETYRASLLVPLYKRIPGRIRRGLLEPLIEALPVSHRRYSLESKLKRFIYGAGREDFPPHCYWRVICRAEDAAQLYTPEFHRATRSSSPLEGYASAMKKIPDRLGRLASLLAGDTRFYLPNDMLAKVDRTSMAFGLEVRVPFMDHHLVSFCFSLPEHLKIGNGNHSKLLLRHSLRKTFPPEIAGRPKAGFNLPLGKWMSGDLLPLLKTHLSKVIVERMGLLQPDQVARLMSEHIMRRFDHSHLLYGILCLSLWWQIWVEKDLAPPPLKEAVSNTARSADSRK